jgi:hypothetical protein
VIFRGRNWWRLGATLALPATVGVVLSPVAAGDATSPVTTQVLVTQSTYFWQGQPGAQNVGGMSVASPAPVTDPTVPTGDVAVAGPEVNMQANKETYLEFDVSAVPAGSTVTSFVVTLPVDQSAQAETFTPTTMTPPIIACTPQGAWSGGANGAQALAGKPKDTCATGAPTFASKDGGKTYTADIAPIAQNWITGINTGVAVADDPTNTSTAYQVVFGDMNALNKLTAQMTYVPGSDTTLNNPGANTSTPETTLPEQTLTVPLVPSGISSSATPSTTPSTTVPSADKGGKSSALRATSYAGAGPPGVFWVAAVLILALLFSASLVLGDEPVDEPKRGRRRLLLAGARQFHASGPATPSKEA